MRKARSKTYSTGFALNGEPLLHKKIEIFKRTLVKNELLEDEEKFVLYKKAYACVIPQTGSLINNTKSETILAKTTHKFIIRFDKNIEDDMEIHFKGKTYTIDYLLNAYNENKYLEIFARVEE